eukprot:UN26230
MWGWGPGNMSGYCGSCSTQMAGIYFGNWITHDAVRNSVGGKMILVNDNLERALVKLNLDYDEFDSNKTYQHEDFIIWVKQHLKKGHPVIAGIFAFLKKSETDADYDHIVPFIGYESKIRQMCMIQMILFIGTIC